MNQEIIKREAGRTPDDRMVLHFYQEGSFYRAYEWSAWLAHRFIKEFKVTHKKMKDVEDSVAYIGFPATSLEKYIPEDATVEISKCGRFPLAKNKVTINLQKTNRHIIINDYAAFDKDSCG